uniref:contact-dependent growth inhibition system immunity protein n=1 Tax=Paractinoplanes polyasparticus TaxID=2856853 RepID=UPI0027E07713|nr:contact-dependent growth inhibition system immunity protein [Actinoplanes polyasparticus]
MDRTIEDIEGVRELEPGPDATPLVRRCLALRRKPLSEFRVEDLRILLGQRIAVPVLLPMAVAVLVDDPLAEGDFYAGDLLNTVVQLPDTAWGSGERERFADVLRAIPRPENKGLRQAIEAFLA